MPAVDGVLDSPLLAALFSVVVVRDSEIGSLEGVPEVPSPAEVILAPSAGDIRLRAAVDIPIVVAFAPPAVAVGENGHDRAHILSSALNLAHRQGLSFWR